MFVLAGRKELVLASLNGKVQAARVHFSCHNSPNSGALAERSRRTEPRAILATIGCENTCIPFKNWLVGPDRPDEWKVTLDKTEDDIVQVVDGVTLRCVTRIRNEL